MENYSFLFRIGITFIAWFCSVMLAYGMVKQDIAVLQAKYAFIEKEISDMKGDLHEIRLLLESNDRRSRQDYR